MGGTASRWVAFGPYPLYAMREQRLLERIQRRSEALCAAFARTVVVGPGDDCAVLRSATGEITLVGVDQLIVGRHCTPDTPVDLIARKAMARAVSDIAAMGGSPTWALGAAKLPADYPDADELFDRCAHWASHWGAPLVGGDIATSQSELALSITVAGIPHPIRGPVLRSGAKVGDVVAVTGPIGDSFTSGWHLNFEPRLDEARRLCDGLGDDLHAMIDVSDGLGLDAHRVGRASGVLIEIDASRVPARDASTTTWRERLSSGEDYELLVTFSPDAQVPEQLQIIGSVREAPDAGRAGAEVVSPTGERVSGAELGWDHGQG